MSQWKDEHLQVHNGVPAGEVGAVHPGGTGQSSCEHRGGVTPQLPPTLAPLCSPESQMPPAASTSKYHRVSITDLNGPQSRNRTGKGLLESAVQLTQADVSRGLSHKP